MRRCDAPRRALPLLGELHDLARPHGVTHLGVAPAAVLDRARAALIERRDAGLADGMAFTYKNPERSTDPGAAVRGARSVIVAARPYLVADPSDPSDSPATGEQREGASLQGRVARYAWHDAYTPLRAGLWAIARRLRDEGWKAVPFADDNSIVDREVAYLAGLGWFGKNANLLVSGAGSWFVLGCVVTDAPLPVNEQPAADGCGPCRRCLDGCPTGAIVAPGVVDASRCLAWLLQKPGVFPVEHRVALGDRMYGCDDCQEVCPPTVRLGERFRAVETGSTSDATVDVLDLLESSDDAILARWGRWYLADRDPRWMRRNALIVVGNSGHGATGALADRIDRVLRLYASGADEILREHAVWAEDRLAGRVGAR